MGTLTRALAPPTSAQNRKKTYNSKTAYVTKICYIPEYAPLQYLSMGAWTEALAPPVSKKGGGTNIYWKLIYSENWYIMRTNI